MTDKAVITDHFSSTAHYWRERIYKPRAEQGVFEYFDKQYRFDRVLEMIPFAPAKNSPALDIGCGAGQLIPYLYERGYAPEALDISKEMVKVALRLCDDLQIPANVQVGDCEHLDYPDQTFELYVAMGVIEYMDNDEKMLCEIARVMKPGGIAIVTTRNYGSIAIRWRNFYQTFIGDPIQNFYRALKGKPALVRKALSREHRPKEFQKRLQRDFRILDDRYAHYHFLPSPLDFIFKPLEALVGKAMEKTLKGCSFPFLASTYIIKLQRI